MGFRKAAINSTYYTFQTSDNTATTSNFWSANKRRWAGVYRESNLRWDKRHVSLTPTRRRQHRFCLVSSQFTGKFDGPFILYGLRLKLLFFSSPHLSLGLEVPPVCVPSDKCSKSGQPSARDQKEKNVELNNSSAGLVRILKTSFYFKSKLSCCHQCRAEVWLQRR